MRPYIFLVAAKANTGMVRMIKMQMKEGHLLFVLVFLSVCRTQTLKREKKTRKRYKNQHEKINSWSHLTHYAIVQRAQRVWSSTPRLSCRFRWLSRNQLTAKLATGSFYTCSLKKERKERERKLEIFLKAISLQLKWTEFTIRKCKKFSFLAALLIWGIFEFIPLVESTFPMLSETNYTCTHRCWHTNSILLLSASCGGSQRWHMLRHTEPTRHKDADHVQYAR